LYLIVNVPGREVSDENDGQVKQVSDVVSVTVPEKVGRDVPELKRNALLA
jgi:hypothetical protein